MTDPDTGTGGLTPAGPSGGPVDGSDTSHPAAARPPLHVAALQWAARHAAALHGAAPKTWRIPGLPAWLDLRRLYLGLVVLGSALSLVAVGMGFQRFLDRPPVLTASASADPHAGDRIGSLDSSGDGGPGGSGPGSGSSAPEPVAAGVRIPGANAPALAAVDHKAAQAVGIHIPRLKLNRSLVDLRMQPDRTLSVPRNFSDVGWWSDGPHPGAAGAALVAGHVSSKSGPAVFWHLADLRAGDRITVDRADHTSAVFQVVGKASYPRSSFPDEVVYRVSGKPSLHLVTCDGSFDPAIGHHEDNLIVFADLVSTTAKPAPAGKHTSAHKAPIRHATPAKRKAATRHPASSTHRTARGR